MKKVQIELVKAWFIKAQHDLGTAHKLSKGPDPFLDTAIYHCQQAAEKSIKGFLVYHNQRFEKTHDLRPMIDMAAKIDTEFSELMDAAELLTPYATEFRYPDDVLEPSGTQFSEALKMAEQFYEFILSRLPENTHP